MGRSHSDACIVATISKKKQKNNNNNSKPRMAIGRVNLTRLGYSQNKRMNLTIKKNLKT
jgi:hypothetical protein